MPWKNLIAMALVGASSPPAEDEAVSEKVERIHASGILIDGHNDLPWRLRDERDMAFEKFDLRTRLDSGHTDIPRLRAGGVDAQFWSVYIPTEHPDPAETVLQQIDLVHRMIEKYPDVFALATTADEVEAAVADGKIASLIGIEGGVAIQEDLALLRNFGRLGVRYMTLTHNGTLSWADAATDEPHHGGLSEFGERVVKEMNRAGILVDISHVSPETMDDVLRVSKAPVIASHSSAKGICPHARNVPDDILARLKDNGGVVMVNFYPTFIVPGAAAKVSAARTELREKFPKEEDYDREYAAWTNANAKEIRGDVKVVADHVDHIVKVAGIDHVGLGGDYDGIGQTPLGMEDVSTYPRLTEELLNRGYDETSIHKLLGGNVLRAMRGAEKVAKELQASTAPDVQQPKVKAEHVD
jgi:membrane dipeptidase